MTNNHSVIRELKIFRGRRLRISRIIPGVTNEKYLIECEGRKYVARFAPKRTKILGIFKASEPYNCRIAYKLGIGPKVVAVHPGLRLTITEYIEGDASRPVRMRTTRHVKQIAKALRRLHQGPRLKDNIDMYKQTKYFFRNAERFGVKMPNRSAHYARIVDTIKRKMRRTASKPSHLDMEIGNIIHSGRTIKLIDWEYSGNSDWRFDLGMLAFKARYRNGEDLLLLKEHGGDVTMRELQLMKCMAGLREAGWAFLQTYLARGSSYDYRKRALDHLKRFERIARKIDIPT